MSMPRAFDRENLGLSDTYEWSMTSKLALGSQNRSSRLYHNRDKEVSFKMTGRLAG